MRVVERRIVHEGSFLRLVTARYADKNGFLRDWEYVERINCEGIVALVPITDDHEVILVRQFRPAVDGYVVEFPAGLNDKGGSLEDAARRELREETGYSAGRLTFLAEGPLSSGASGEILTVYLAQDLRYTGPPEPDESEEIEVMRVPLPAVFEFLSAMQSEGNLVDVKIFGFLALAARKMNA